MVVARRALDEHAAAALIDRTCFPEGVDDRVGLEIELLCAGDAWSDGPAAHGTVKAAVERISLTGGRVTWEPGGQLELSGQPFPDAGRAVVAARADLLRLGTAVEQCGGHLLPVAMEPTRLPARVVRQGRYDAMEAYFDADGPAGRRMMRATAALQVNLGLGPDPDQRWGVVHAVGPALVAAFANSPLAGGGVTGWQSTRFANWLLIDPSRTAPSVGAGATRAWSAAVLRARVMLVRGPDGRCEAVRRPLSFGQWLDAGHELGWPDADDLAYHLTTLFPPVRARGWLEVRYLDVSPWWDVAALVLDALTRHPDAGRAARRACRGTEQHWVAAAREGAHHPELAAAAVAVCAVAAETLEGEHPDGAARCRDFLGRFPQRRRSPADELVERWRARSHHAMRDPVVVS